MGNHCVQSSAVDSVIASPPSICTMPVQIKHEDESKKLCAHAFCQHGLFHLPTSSAVQILFEEHLSRLVGEKVTQVKSCSVELDTLFWARLRQQDQRMVPGALFRSSSCKKTHRLEVVISDAVRHHWVSRLLKLQEHPSPRTLHLAVHCFDRFATADATHSRVGEILHPDIWAIVCLFIASKYEVCGQSMMHLFFFSLGAIRMSTRFDLNRLLNGARTSG